MTPQFHTRYMHSIKKAQLCAGEDSVERDHWNCSQADLKVYKCYLTAQWKKNYVVASTVFPEEAGWSGNTIFQFGVMDLKQPVPDC